MADQPCTNTLDHTKFHVAVRLIQLFQNGKKPVDFALNVSSMEGGGGSGIMMKPPYFEGVEIPALAMPPQPQQQQAMPQQSSYSSSPQIQPAPSSSPQRSPVVPQPTIGMVMPPPLPLPTAATMNTNTMTTTTTTTTLAIQDPYTMTPQELSRYDALFPMYAKEDAADGKMYVSGATAVELFCKSGKFIWLFFSGGGGGGCSYANKL